jgi:hypothetical protein
LAVRRWSLARGREARPRRWANHQRLATNDLLSNLLLPPYLPQPYKCEGQYRCACRSDALHRRSFF